MPSAMSKQLYFPIEDRDRIAFEMIIRSALAEVQRYVSDKIYVSGSCALWIADKSAKWEPDDIDIAVPAKHWFDLVGRLMLVAGKERVKKEASGFCFERNLKGSKLGRNKIRVQVFPSLNPMVAISHFDFDGVRCYAEPAGTFSMKVTWCDGVDYNKVLTEKKLDHYVCRDALDADGNILPKYEAMRKRVQKYADRGYTITNVVSDTAHSPYDEGYTWTKPNNCPPGATKLCNEVTRPPINGWGLIQLGYIGNETRRLAMRWLEQEWLKSGCKLGYNELSAMAQKARAPPFPLQNVNPDEVGMSGCEWADFRIKAEQLWINSGFTLTKEQLLEKVRTPPEDKSEMKPEDLFA